MSNITPIKPSFVFGYWRPWKEDSNLFDSYMDYARDTSLAKYGADTVGKYIHQASLQQVQAIGQLGQAVGRGMDVLSNQMNVLSSQMSDINSELSFLNRNMDIQIEQQKLSNLLLQNIAELLRVPDSEKERQHSIELGIKFFVNAKKDTDLYADALEELLKAESLMKQDYFVLHRLGCIYLYVEKYINPEKAFDYFIRAGKYASVESDKGAVKLANALTKNFNTSNSAITYSEEQIGLLASDSYEKAAFAAYVLGRFEDAVNNQSKVVKFNSTPNNRFTLAKYQIRNGKIDEAVDNLNRCIDEEPVLAIAAFREIDLINEPAVTNLITAKNNEINSKLNQLIEKWKSIESVKVGKAVSQLNKLSKKSYETKVADYHKYLLHSNKINSQLNILKQSIDTAIEKIQKGNVNSSKVKEIVQQLSQAKALPIEQILGKLLQPVYKRLEEIIKNEIDGVILIDKLLKKTKKATFVNFDSKKVEVIFQELNQAKGLPIEQMQATCQKLEKEIEADKLKVGSNYAGGIVFHIDESGKNGLVCTKSSIGKAIWGISNGNNLKTTENGKNNTALILKHASSKSTLFSSNVQIKTAALLCSNCREGGFNDWYLPSWREFSLLNNCYQIKQITPIKFRHISKCTPGDAEQIGFYWTSNQCPGQAGFAYIGIKNEILYLLDYISLELEVIPIRAFHIDK